MKRKYSFDELFKNLKEDYATYKNLAKSLNLSTRQLRRYRKEGIKNKKLNKKIYRKLYRRNRYYEVEKSRVKMFNPIYEYVDNHGKNQFRSWGFTFKQYLKDAIESLENKIITDYDFGYIVNLEIESRYFKQ